MELACEHIMHAWECWLTHTSAQILDYRNAEFRTRVPRSRMCACVINAFFLRSYRGLSMCAWRGGVSVFSSSRRTRACVPAAFSFFFPPADAHTGRASEKIILTGTLQRV